LVFLLAFQTLGAWGQTLVGFLLRSVGAFASICGLKNSGTVPDPAWFFLLAFQTLGAWGQTLVGFLLRSVGAFASICGLKNSGTVPDPAWFPIRLGFFC
jgi:hypothetical protein